MASSSNATSLVLALCLGLVAAPGCGPDAGSGPSTGSSGGGGDSSTAGAGGDASTAGAGGTGGGTPSGGAGGVGGEPSNGDVLWMKQFGTPAEEEARSLDVDSAGDLLIAGYDNGAINFGGGPLAAPPAGAIWGHVAKLDQNGNHLWSKRLKAISSGDPVWVVVTCARFDGAGNVLVVGSYTGTGDFGAGQTTAAGLSDVFVQKLDSDGNLLWARTFGTPGPDSASCALDSQDNVLLTGQFGDQIDFGGGPLAGDAGEGATFVAKLDPDGNHLWSQSFLSSAGTVAVGLVEADSADDVWVAGAFRGEMSIAGQVFPGVHSPIGGWDAFLAKLAPDGTSMWANSPSSSPGISPFLLDAMDLGPAGELLMVGHDEQDSSTILQIDPSGSLLSSQLASSGGFHAFDVSTDSTGDILLAGSSYNESLPGRYIRVDRRSASGDLLWKKTWRTESPHGVAKCVRPDPNDDVVVFANIGAVTDLGGGTMLTSLGGWDHLLVRLAK